MRGESFDRITRAMATGTSRRGMLKAFAAGVAGLAVATIRPGSSEAQAYPTLPCIPLPPAEGPILIEECNFIYGNALTNLPNSAQAGCCTALGMCEQGPVFGTDHTCQCGGTCSFTCGVGTCSCVTTTEGTTACVTPNLGCVALVPCNKSTDCAAGSVCFTQGCCGPSPQAGFCVARCAVPAAAPAAAGKMVTPMTHWTNR